MMFICYSLKLRIFSGRTRYTLLDGIIALEEIEWNLLPVCYYIVNQNHRHGMHVIEWHSFLF